MSKSYWIKKNHHNDGAETAWIEMDGREFYKFIMSPDGKGRYFIKLTDKFEGECEDVIFIEATKSEYLKWRSEENHSNYLKKIERDYTTISLYAMEKANECNGEDVTADPSVDVENEAMSALLHENMTDALLYLSADERLLIDEIYLSNNPKTEREIAMTLGISQVAVNKRKNNILKKLKKLVIKL